nr:serine/threonine-protein kinase RUNKEL [Tanacetum cinerariifolium]GEY14671.1 serine/threonine-protein kinase RUNKEL [Tanacetum cinerariifolium]
MIVDIQQLSGVKQMQVGGLTPGKGVGLKTNLQLFLVVPNLLDSSSFKRMVVSSKVLQQLKVLIKLVESPFQLTLLRILETIPEEPTVIEENHTTFVSEILPSLSALLKEAKMAMQDSYAGGVRYYRTTISFVIILDVTQMYSWSDCYQLLRQDFWQKNSLGKSFSSTALDVFCIRVPKYHTVRNVLYLTMTAFEESEDSEAGARCCCGNRKRGSLSYFLLRRGWLSLGGLSCNNLDQQNHSLTGE